MRQIETVVKDPALVELRHERICDVALHLFARKGYHQTSVREIAEAANLSVGALYTYVKAKEDILLLVYQRIFGLFREQMTATSIEHDNPTARLRAAIEATLRIYDQYQDLILVLYQESHALRREALRQLFDVDRRYVGMIQAIIEKGNREGHFACEDPTVSAIAIVFLCAVWPLKRWNLKTYGIDAVIRGVSGLILHGIGRHDGFRPYGGTHGISDDRVRR
jgi:AcrR family transcriptional regulator